MVGALQAVFLALGLPPLLGRHRDLVDPDSYMRLLRVERLWDTGVWYDGSSPWTNAPFGGDVLHWTRPLDVLLIVGAWPLSLIATPRDALFWAGVVVSPLLQIMSVVVLYWGTLRLLSGSAYVLMAALFGVQLFSRNYYLPARPDHHSLQLFLFAVVVSLLLNLAARPKRRGLAGALGIATSLALWVSPEALVPIAWVCGLFGLFYVAYGDPWQSRLADYLGAISVGLLVALPLERGWAGMLAVEYDRLSIVHLSLFGGMACVWTAIVAWSPTGRSWSARLWVGIAATGSVAVVMALVFPRFFLGPFVDVDPGMGIGWLFPINEFPWLIGPGRTLSAHWVYAFGPLVIALPFATVAFRFRREPGRPVWLVPLTAMIGFVPFALYDARLAPYVELPMVIAWCVAVQDAAGWLGRTRFRAVLLGAMLCTHGAVAAVLLASNDTYWQETPRCDWGAVVPVLQDLESSDDDGPIVFTLPHQGPEMVYRTGFRVVGAPYHRNGRAFLHSREVLRAAEDERARELLMARDVDYVVLCRHAPEVRRYLRDGADVLLARLLAGAHPTWLRPIPLPEGLGDSFILLAVAP